MTITRTLAAVVLLFVHGTAACDAPQTPVIRVGIGMTVDELRASSTYNFKDGVLRSPIRNNWMITRPYDLAFIYKGRELRKAGLGGDNYFIAINTAPMSQRVIDFIQITFQNRALTLDEALTEAQSLQTWFTEAGFHTPSSTTPNANHIPAPFSITQPASGVSRYEPHIENYSHARVAFLDPAARILAIRPFTLVTDDARAGLEIANARRRLYASDATTDETNAATERAYFLNLGVMAWPAKRHWDGMKAK
jgi:hypothetical protein